ncbi:MAG: tRNA (adenosine(37)-N6)-dimethylallyltransferase MiaA [Planctomycetales bacterium]|nr:tRNA (adenosine(37)-N6)-dimethylallyltransferase MiaA [Planctomycetales bacterium]
MPHQETFQPATDAWFLSGPTAAGKTRVGLELAERLGAEILSLDSMAIYREMDVGTAKPTPEQRRRVPHHLLDLVDPSEEFSLAEYVDAAHVAAAEVHARGKRALFVGGTPLYLKSLLRGLYTGPPPDWDFRREVADETARVGVAALHERLAQVDPLSAARLHPNDQRRIIRALEVYRVAGKPLSHMQTQFERGRPAEACRVFVLQWPRVQLHRRIETRVDAMFQQGLVEEVRQLLAQHASLSRTASQAVGYCEAIAQLQGERSPDECREATKTRTRRFARRQETWFRSLSECRLVEVKGESDLDAAAERIAAAAN